LADVHRRSSGEAGHVRPGRTRAAAEGTPGAEAMAIGAAHDDHRARMADLEFVFHPEAPAAATRALTVGPQAEAPHEDRSLRLDHLDRNVAKECGAVVDGVDAVEGSAASGAALHRVDHDDP